MSTPEQSNDPQAAAPLKSTLSSDPDMVELVEFFVQDMNERIDTIQNAAQENNVGQLRIVAHQLKGAATGYGFAPISRSAAALEKLIDSAGPTAEANSLRTQVDELIDLCRRASA